jgi:hypothetical protein
MTVADHELTSSLDLSAHVLLNPSHIGTPRAEAVMGRLGQLNPLVQLHSTLLPSDPDQRAQHVTHMILHQGPWHLVVVAEDAPMSTLAAYNSAVRSASAAAAASAPIGFIVLQARGSFGWSFFDFGPQYVYHTRPVATGNSADTSKPTVLDFRVDYTPIVADWHRKVGKEPKHTLLWAFIALQIFVEQHPDTTPTVDLLRPIAASLQTQFNIVSRNMPTDRHLAAMLQPVGFHIAPLTAVLGGLVGQEVIKYLTRMDAPLFNSFWYESQSGDNSVEILPAS